MKAPRARAPIEVLLPPRVTAAEAQRLIAVAQRDAFIEECRHELAADIQRLKRIEIAKYTQDASYRNEDWLQWSTDEQKEEALLEVRRALALAPESALLRIQLLMSALIARAAIGHADICERNGRLFAEN